MLVDIFKKSKSEALQDGFVATSQSGSYDISNFNPDVNISTMLKMMKTAPVRAAIGLIQNPILKQGYIIKCENEEQKAFYEKILKPVWINYVKNILLGHFIGFKACEKRWKIQDIIIKVNNKTKILKNMYVPKKLHSFPVTGVEVLPPEKDENGGMTYYTGFKFMDVIFPNYKTLWITNDIEEANMNLYGKGILPYAYSPGWKDWIIDLEYKRRFMERYSDPPIFGKAPKGKNDKNEEFTATLSSRLKTVRNGGNIVVPSKGDRDKSGEYDVKLLEPKMNPSNFHLEVLNYDERLIIVALIQASANILAAKSHTGSFGEKEADIDFYISSLESLLPWIEFYLNNYVMPDIRNYNFGLNAPDVSVVIPKIDDEKKRTASQIYHALIQNGLLGADLKYLEEQTGIPPQEIKVETKEKDKKLSFNLSNNMIREITNIDNKYSLLLKKLVEKTKKNIIKEAKKVKTVEDIGNINTLVWESQDEWLDIVREYANNIYIQGQDMGIQILQKSQILLEKTASTEEIQKKDSENQSYISQSTSIDSDKKFANIKQKITYSMNDVIIGKKKKAEAYTEIEESIDQLYSEQTDSGNSNYLILIASVVIGKGIDYIYRKYWNKIHGFERNEIMDSKTCVVCQGIHGLRIKRDDPRYESLMSVHPGCRGWWETY